MFRFVVRRLLQLLLIVWGGATLLFFLFFALPSDPAELIASQGGQRAPDPQVVANIEAKYGFDDPMIVQYKNYISRLLHGDLGQSYQSSRSVWDIVKERLPTSLRLAFWAILIEATIGIGSGVLSARRRNSVADVTTTLAAVILSAIPVFILALLVRQVTGVYANQHDWPAWAQFPIFSTEISDGEGWILGIIPKPETFEYLIIPAFVLACVSTAVVARLTRSSNLETMRMDHVRTARAKGLSERQVSRHHVTRNALIPVVTFIGIDFGTLVGSAILTETVFNIRGLGSSIVDAANARDLPVMLGLSMVVIFIYGVANLLVDISYAWLDPRIRMGGPEE